MSAWQIVRDGLRYRAAHDYWFAKMMTAAREGRPFDEPEPRIEDYVPLRNQCDGCMQGTDLRNGLHVDRYSHAFMGCEREKYAAGAAGVMGDPDVTDKGAAPTQGGSDDA